MRRFGPFGVSFLCVGDYVFYAFGFGTKPQKPQVVSIRVRYVPGVKVDRAATKEIVSASAEIIGLVEQDKMTTYQPNGGGHVKLTLSVNY